MIVPVPPVAVIGIVVAGLSIGEQAAAVAAGETVTAGDTVTVTGRPAGVAATG